MTIEMACRELVELATDYFEGALDEPTRARLEAHLSDCGYCETYLAQMRAAIRLTGTLAVDEVPPDVIEALTTAFRRRADP